MTLLATLRLPVSASRFAGAHEDTNELIGLFPEWLGFRTGTEFRFGQDLQPESRFVGLFDGIP